MEVDDDFKYFAPALVALRKRSEKSARTVAKEIGRSPAVISRFEEGEHDLGSRDLMRYLKAVGASLAELQLAMRVLKMLRSGPEPEPERGELQFVMKVLRVVRSGAISEPEKNDEVTRPVDPGASSKREEP